MRNKVLVNYVAVGDSLDLLLELPDNCVDIVVTSPPYNKRNKANGWLVGNATYSHFDDHMPEGEYQIWQEKVLNELFRVVKPGGEVFYNHKLRWDGGVLHHPIVWLSNTKWTIRQEIVWDRGLAANMRGWRYWQTDERVYWLHKPKGDYLIGEELESRHAKLSSIWRLKPASRSKDHPAPFPVELPTRIISSFIKEGQKLVVLDPFCGTGTTLVAAKLLGQDYIGFDLSPQYAEFATQRLEKASDEMSEVQAELDKHVVTDTFKKIKERGNTNWPFKGKSINNKN